MVEQILLALKQVPSEFYATVVGALIALGGVALSNKSAMQQLARQLEHATSERRRQEEADLRRSVLLGGVDAFAGLSNHLSRFADLRAAAQEDPVEVQRRAGALAKVQLAVSGETLRVIQHAAGVYGRATFELTLLRGRLVAAQTEFATINQLVSSGVVPREKVQGFLVARDQAQKRVREIGLDLLSKTMDRVIELGEAILPVMLAFRKELEIPLDEELFRAETSRTLDALKEQKQRFIAQIQGA